MVEIIKRGQIPEEKVYDVTCRKCRSELRFKRREAKFSDDQRDPALIISCPVCRTEVYTKP